MIRKNIIWKTIGFAVIPILIISALALYNFNKYKPRPTPNPNPTILQTIPTPSTMPDDEELIAIARKRFEEGKIAFRHPDEMAEGKSEMLEARITHQPQTDSLLQGLKGRGQTVVEQLKVSCRMRLTLTAADNLFDIKSLTPQEVRLLDPQEPYSSWKWDITPKEPGTHEIHLIAEAFTNLPGEGEKSLYIKTFDYTIRVKVTAASVLNWAGRHWQNILGSITLAMALAASLWKIYSKRKEKRESKPTEPPRIITS